MLDDLAVYEAIYEAGDSGLTIDELAERFDVDKWQAHDVCLKLRDDGFVTSRPRSGTNLIVFVPQERKPGRPSSGHTEPFI